MVIVKFDGKREVVVSVDRDRNSRYREYSNLFELVFVL